MAGLFAVELLTNVVSCRSHHGFDHVARLRRSGGYWRLAQRRDGDTDTDRVDVLESWVALVFIHQDKASWIHESFNAQQAIDALECRQHHAVFEGQFMLLFFLTVFIEFSHVHHAGFDTVDLGIADPVNVLVTKFAFKQSFGIANAAQT